MDKENLILWGATGQAIVLEEILRHNYSLVAIFDNRDILSPFDSVPLFVGLEGFEKWKKRSVTSSTCFHVAIGGDRGLDRLERIEFLKEQGMKSINAIHANSFVAYNASIGNSVQIMAHATVCAKTTLGNGVIINTSASIDHECCIAEGVHIGPGAKLAGCIEVGKHTFIGTGAVILPRIKIGCNATIGAGSVVTRNIPDNVVAYGNPCQIIRSK